MTQGYRFAQVSARAWVELRRRLVAGTACVLAGLILTTSPGLFAADPALSADVASGSLQDATVLADRMLRRQSTGLLLNPKRSDRLTQEIGQVLDRVRTAYPPAWEVSARMDFRPGILLVGLTPALLSAAVPAGREEGQPTGHVEFDDLNTRLGLSDMRVFLHVGVALLEFSKHVHLEAAARAYLEIPGVRFAQPDALLGDGPDIEVVRVQETWYVIVRKAWGDCPSKCLHEELFFFTVENDVARRVEALEAMQQPAFAKLAAIRDWHDR